MIGRERKVVRRRQSVENWYFGRGKEHRGDYCLICESRGGRQYAVGYELSTCCHGKCRWGAREKSQIAKQKERSYDAIWVGPRDKNFDAGRRAAVGRGKGRCRATRLEVWVGLVW